MKRETVFDYYGSQSKLRKNIGLTRQAVNQWPDPIPVMWALKLDYLTNGALVFDKTLYQIPDDAV